MATHLELAVHQAALRLRQILDLRARLVAGGRHLVFAATLSHKVQFSLSF